MFWDFFDIDLEDIFIFILLLFFLLSIVFLIFLPLWDLPDYDSTVEATVINVELEGGNFPDRLVSYEYEVDEVVYRDVDEVSAMSYYAIGDVITIEYQSEDITETRIVTEG